MTSLDDYARRIEFYRQHLEQMKRTERAIEKWATIIASIAVLATLMFAGYSALTRNDYPRQNYEVR